MNLIQTIKSSITEPKKFLSAISSKKTLTEAFTIYLIFVLATAVLYIFPAYLDISQEFNYSQSMTTIIVIAFIVFIIIASLGLIFFAIGIHHLFLKLLGGKGSYVDTFNARIFSAMPSYIVGLIFLVIMFFFRLAVTNIDEASFPALIIYFIMVGFLILISLGVTIYCLYWYCFALSLLHKITKLRAFTAVFLIPLAIFGTLFILLLIFLFIFGMIAASGI